MFPGLGGLGSLDPKKMQAMMKQLGMDQEEVAAEKVIIEKPDGKIIIENPSVTKITIKGQETFQVSGNVSEQTGIFDADIHAVMEKTGSSFDDAKSALEASNGDLAEAILSLS